MRSAFSNCILVIAFLCSAAGLGAQINPHTQIRWPVSCAAPGMVYNFQNNVCIASGTAANPAGADTQVQFNLAGAFGADTLLTFNRTTHTLNAQAFAGAGTGLTGTAASLTAGHANNLPADFATQSASTPAAGTFTTDTATSFAGAGTGLTGTGASFTAGHANNLPADFATQSASTPAAGTFTTTNVSGAGTFGTIAAGKPIPGSYPANSAALGGYLKRLQPPTLLAQVTPTTITDTPFCMVGVMWRWQSGTLGKACFQPSTLSGYWQGPIELRTSSDGGTWSAQTSVSFSCGNNCTNVTGGITPSGRLVLCTQPALAQTLAKCRYEDDDTSLTWSTEVSTTCPQAGCTTWGYYGHIIRTPLGLGMAAWSTDGTTYESWMCESLDDGATWPAGQCYLLDSSAEPEEHDEAALFNAGNSNIIAVMRVNGTSARNGPAQSLSTDGGHTWTHQGYCSGFDTSMTGHTINFPFEILPITDTDGKLTADMVYFRRYDLNLKMVQGDPSLLISSGCSGWSASSLQQLFTSTGSTNGGYPAMVGDDLGYAVGAFTDVNAGNTASAQQFYTLSETGVVRANLLPTSGGTLTGSLTIKSNTGNPLLVQTTVAQPIVAQRFNTGGPGIQAGLARGTVSSPTDVLNGDWIADYDFIAYKNGAWRVGSYIQSSVDAAPGSTFVPSRITVHVTNAAGTDVEAMRVANSGNVLFGQTTDCAQSVCAQSIGLDTGNTNRLSITQSTVQTTFKSLTGTDFIFQNNTGALMFGLGATKFTATGCTSITSTVGFGTSGRFVIGGNTCTVVITISGAQGMTAANGWSCHANDETTAAGNTGLYFSTNNTTTATLTVPATAIASDVIDFNCQPY